MNQTSPITATSSEGGPSQHHRARVLYQNGMLEVRADNSSLNQILREISRQTGMSIVGGVADQRIFGNYGPAPAATVLKTLLDGTGTNMLLKETATTAPSQLILTPQSGGASYPNPNSASFDATETEPQLGAAGALPITGVNGSAGNPGASLGSPAGPAVPATGTALGPPGPASLYPTMPAPMNNPNGSPNNVSPTAATLPVTTSVPTDSLPTPSTAQPASGIVDAPNPPPAGSTTAGFTGATADNNPNNPPAGAGSPPQGALTPQQVYEQLRQMEQKKNQQPTSPNSPAASPSTQNPQGQPAPQP